MGRGGGEVGNLGERVREEAFEAIAIPLFRLNLILGFFAV